ncbi:CoA transferase [Aestuariibius sp. HNIBRBA575]|uniref:CoA transferase n=1 Tax=Aestuariibius sp. HNIBRBA575 TaxID=3233343 RepID=UPI0034A2D53E
MSGILTGMRIVEGSAFVAVPLAGMTLAQMGADVIRFDRLGGGLDATRWPVAPNGNSHFWAGMNKGKRSIALDMRSPRGRELVTQIITAPGKDAGMFMTNLKVRGWMDHETLSQHRKDLIMVSLKGDRHGRPAVDYTVNPALGFPAITGPEGSTDPVAHALPAWDCVAGQLMVSALLAAERHRFKTGRGQDVEFSLKDVGAAMLGNLGIIGDTAMGGTKRQKSGNALYGAYGQDFICADGQRIMVIGLTGRQWRGLISATETQAPLDALSTSLGVDFDDEGMRYIHRNAITDLFKPWFAARDAASIGKQFDELGLTWSLFRDFESALSNDDDLSTENPMFSEIENPGLGRFLVPGSPLNFSDYDRDEPSPAPILGANTEEILGDVVGLPDVEIASLFDEGVVKGPAGKNMRPAA